MLLKDWEHTPGLAVLLQGGELRLGISDLLQGMGEVMPTPVEIDLQCSYFILQ